MNKNILMAARLYEDAVKLMDKAEALLNTEGIEVCDTMKMFYEDEKEIEIQLYSGINKMECPERKVGVRPRLFKSLENTNKTKWIKYENVNFIQFCDDFEEDSVEEDNSNEEA